MPSKYMIHTKTVPNRFASVSKSGIIAWEEGCLKCAVCVKKRCVYGVYDKRGLDSRHMIESIDNLCMNCYRCVQSCPKELIHKSINPEFTAMGDAHWSPQIIARLWFQAETGKIPVSGAGYPGPFSGPGFDSMWTDMSEIVRPTRDGIHGREYISTAVDLGKTPEHLIFNDRGSLEGEVPAIIDIPLPIILRVPSFGRISSNTIKGWAMGTRHLSTLMALPLEEIDSALEDMGGWLMPLVFPEGAEVGNIPKSARIIELPWTEGWQGIVEDLKKSFPNLLVSIRIPMAESIEEKALFLARGGVSIIHLEGSTMSRFMDDNTRSLKDGIRSVHKALISENIRDRVTLLASGGLSMAEHVAKAIICGADTVFVDFPILIALECRMCRRCVKGLTCPVEIDKASPNWVASRVENLMGAWHNQLLEVMGAMGIRDARRLRGEAGRAMFFEDMDQTAFGALGEVGEGYELE